MYCGCATQKNKSLWATFTVFIVLFAISWILWQVFGGKCRNDADAAGASRSAVLDVKLPVMLKSRLQLLCASSLNAQR